MNRIETSPTFAALIQSARGLAEKVEAKGLLLLADQAYEFKAIKKLLGDVSFIVATHVLEVQEAVRQDEVPLIALGHEPQTRQVQVSQGLLEAIADGLLKTGDRVIALYSGFDRETVDSVSLISLNEHLARLTSRDLQRLETQVPLGTLRRVVDLAVEIGREGREGKKVGTIFVVGNHRKVMELSHEGVHDPFRGYAKKDKMISNSRVRESIKELAQIDGAFVIAADGCVIAAGRMLDAPAQELTLSKGLGARHWAAAAISKATGAISIAVSESTGTVRLFRGGTVVLRIEPMLQALKWLDYDTESPME